MTWVVALVPLLGLVSAVAVASSGGAARQTWSTAVLIVGVAALVLAGLTTILDPKPLRSWSWLIGVIAFTAMVPLLYVRARRSKGAASARVQRAAIGALLVSCFGVSFIAAFLALRVISGYDLANRLQQTMPPSMLAAGGNVSTCQSLTERDGAVALCDWMVNGQKLTMLVTYHAGGPVTLAPEGSGWAV